MDEFKRVYSSIGEQFAKEMLLCVASRNVQEYSEPDFRIRRHLCLYWKPGWLKSHFLKKTYDLLGKELCIIMSTVTDAGLRGSVEAGKFISPYTLKRKFAVCTEFGQLATGGESTEIIQRLLNVLEEGILNVTLGKISHLNEEDRKLASNEYGITFIDDNSFSYNTNWVLFCGTYNRKFLVDNALQSRFKVMSPNGDLDGKIIKQVVEATNSHKFEIPLDAVVGLRKEILKEQPTNLKVELPEELYDLPRLTMRDAGSIIGNTVCKRWWGIETNGTEIMQQAKERLKEEREVWETADDRILNCLEGQPLTVDELVERSGLSKMQVYYSLKRVRALRQRDFDKGTVRYQI